jgi:Tol biopolymer transport system component
VITKDMDLNTTQRATLFDAWDPLVALDALNTSSFEQSPHMTEDRLSIYFESNHVAGQFDILVTTRATTADPFPVASTVVDLSSPLSDEEPWLSPDGNTMVFTSDRGGTREFWISTRQ